MSNKSKNLKPLTKIQEARLESRRDGIVEANNFILRQIQERIEVLNNKLKQLKFKGFTEEAIINQYYARINELLVLKIKIKSWYRIGTITRIKEAKKMSDGKMYEDFEYCGCGNQLVTEEEQRDKMCRECK